MTGNTYFDTGLILTIMFSVCWFSFWFIANALDIGDYTIRSDSEVCAFVFITLVLHSVIFLAYPLLIVGTALFLLLRTLYRYINVRKDKIKEKLRSIVE